MANKQKFLNNFITQFIVAVKDARVGAYPELDYDILRVSQGAATYLTDPTGGDFYIVTAYKKSGTVETNIEIMKVTDVDTSVINETRITVERAQEGTTAQQYVPGDYLELRFTKGGADGFLQAADNLASVASASTARANLGLAIGTDVQAWDTDLDWVAANITPAGKAILDDADAAAQRTTLGLGGAAVLSVGTTAGTVAAGDHAHSGVYQPLDATLTALAGVTVAADKLIYATGADAFAVTDLTAAARALLDDADATAQRTTLGLGTAATQNISGSDITNWNGKANAASPVFTGSLRGDFDTATALASRVFFQGSVTNGSTDLTTVPNGTSTRSGWTAINTSSTTNYGFVSLLALSAEMRLWSGKVGTGTVLPLTVYTDSSKRSEWGASGGFDLFTGLREARVAMGANDVDVRSGNYFTKTISGATTLTVSNVPASGTTASFVLELTNGGSATVTWWSGMKWAGGTAPTLTASGVDILGFYTHDGGTTWRGMVLAKDSK